MFKTIAAIAMIGMANAYISTGAGPTPALQENFDAVRYMGTWNEQARDAGMPWESNDCQQARYGLNADGTVSVYNTQYDPATGEVSGANAVATFNGAKGAVSFFAYAPPGDYEVLATDYTNYAIVYSCSNFYLAKSEYIWVLTRQQVVDEQTIYSALQTLKGKVPDYDLTSVRRTLQGDAYQCKYFTPTASI